METKTTLTIGGVEHTLDSNSLKNWDDVMCTHRRSDYGGVIRSFTSKFEFVNEAYDLLLAEYLLHRFGADAKVAVWTINDEWSYDKQFECALDFTTVTIENKTFSVSAVDNSIEALIKANKSTKYEFVVGTDIIADGTFTFDRLPMTESVTYGLTQGESETQSEAITVRIDKTDGNLVWMGSTASEIVVGGSISYKEDQETDSNSYMLTAIKAVSVSVVSEVTVDGYHSSGVPKTIFLCRYDKAGTLVSSHPICTLGAVGHVNLGEFASADALKEQYPEHSGAPTGDENKWMATIGGIVWLYTHNGTSSVWESTGQTLSECSQLWQTTSINTTLDLNPGDKVKACVTWGESEAYSSSRVLHSEIKFTWQATGAPCESDAFKPYTVIEALLLKMCTGNYLAVPEISDYDPRLARTVLMAAESIRGIEGAKLYSSFSEFCDWMETVFGYTYCLGHCWESGFTEDTKEFKYFMKTNVEDSEGDAPTEFTTEDIIYNITMGKFQLHPQTGWDFWSVFPSSDQYNDPITGGPRTDRLFRQKDSGKYFFFRVNDDGTTNPNPVEYRYDPADKEKPFQEITFKHRSEIFDPSASVKDIANAKEVSFKVDSSAIYSTVEIGYEAKDYDSVNGRDEFNFNNTYSTGCDLSTKKFSLMSKYRADSYGIEFAAQKRQSTTTDTTSDNDVFFAYCETAYPTGNVYKADISSTLTGVLSDKVFNSIFSPIRCVEANAGYIGMQADSVILTFASSTGNSDVAIDGLALTADITLDTPLMTTSEVSFSTDDLETPDTDGLVRIANDGIVYTGYVKEVEEPFSREQAVKYTLMIKTMQPC